MDEKASEAGAFAKEIRATFPVVHDVKSAVFQKYGVEPIPANVVINRKGRVVGSVEGAKLPQIEAAIKKALASK